MSGGARWRLVPSCGTAASVPPAQVLASTFLFALYLRVLLFLLPHTLPPVRLPREPAQRLRGSVQAVLR